MLIKSAFYRSNGKLLITGEYLVLKGAKALATPCIPGQSLTIFDSNLPKYWQWTISEMGNPIHEILFDSDLNILEQTNTNFRNDFLLNTFKHLIRFKPELKNKLNGLHFSANLEFQLNSGLGSSSSLLANLAQWAGINPFELHFAATNGSGYDIACALSERPILYQLENGIPTSEEVTFSPSFKDQIYFLHLGNKQDSSKSVNLFNRQSKNYDSAIENINQLSLAILEANSLNDFNLIINEHEKLMASILKEAPVKQKYFSNFDGEMKSLGAWGGDFVMLTWPYDKTDLEVYFSRKNLNQIVSFGELIKTGE